MSPSRLGRVLRAGLAAAAAARGTRLVLDRMTTPGDLRWTRTNHRGAAVSLLEGPAVAAGLIVGTVLGGPRRAGLAGAVAAAGAAAFGLVDDLTEDEGR